MQEKDGQEKEEVEGLFNVYNLVLLDKLFNHVFFANLIWDECTDFLTRNHEFLVMMLLPLVLCGLPIQFTVYIHKKKFRGR